MRKFVRSPTQLWVVIKTGMWLFCTRSSGTAIDNFPGSMIQEGGFNEKAARRSVGVTKRTEPWCLRRQVAKGSAASRDKGLGGEAHARGRVARGRSFLPCKLRAGTREDEVPRGALFSPVCKPSAGTLEDGVPRGALLSPVQAQCWHARGRGALRGSSSSRAGSTLAADMGFQVELPPHSQGLCRWRRCCAL